MHASPKKQNRKKSQPIVIPKREKVFSNVLALKPKPFVHGKMRNVLSLDGALEQAIRKTPLEKMVQAREKKPSSSQSSFAGLGPAKEKQPLRNVLEKTIAENEQIMLGRPRPQQKIGQEQPALESLSLEKKKPTWWEVAINGNLMIILFALAMTVLPVVGITGTGSFFHDRERLADNGFSAGMLDLVASSTEVLGMMIAEEGQGTLESYIGPHEESLESIFNGHAEFVSGSEIFCDLLYLRAKKDNEQVYWGSLLNFNVFDITEEGDWSFLVKFPYQNDHVIEDDTQCNVDLVFSGYEATASWIEESGYTDTERIPLRIMKSEYSCIGPNCETWEIEGEEETGTTTPSDTGTTTSSTTDDVVDTDTGTSTDDGSENATSTEQATTTPEVEDEEETDENESEEEQEDEEESHEEEEETEDVETDSRRTYERPDRPDPRERREEIEERRPERPSPRDRRS